MYKPLPDGLTISISAIEGLGLFAESFVKKGTNFGVSHMKMNGMLIRTPLGGFINHSDTPNCTKSKYFMTNTDDVKIKPTSNLQRKEMDSSKLEKVLEDLQDHLSKNPLEEKAKTYDIGQGRKTIGTFTDSFEGHGNADASDTYYSTSIDRVNNVLRPEFVAKEG